MRFIYVFIYFISLTMFWTGLGHKCRPFSPMIYIRVSIFFVQRVHYSHCSSICVYFFSVCAPILCLSVSRPLIPSALLVDTDSALLRHELAYILGEEVVRGVPLASVACI